MSRRHRSSAVIENGARCGGHLPYHRAEIITKLTNLLIAVTWLFLERLIHHLLEFWWNRSGTRFGQGYRFFVQHRMTHIDGCSPPKRPCAGQHFVEQNAS